MQRTASTLRESRKDEATSNEHETVGKHRWNGECKHGAFSGPAYGYLAFNLFRCENCGQSSVIYPSSRDKDGYKLPHYH